MSIPRLWIPRFNRLPNAVLHKDELVGNSFKEFIEMSPLYYIKNISKKYFIKSIIYKWYMTGRLNGLQKMRIEYEIEKQTIIFEDGDTMSIATLKKVQMSNLYGTMLNRRESESTFKHLRNKIIMEDFLYLKTFAKSII